MERPCHLPFGTFPASLAAGINLFDVLAHTWDIAAATGVALECADDLWQAAYTEAGWSAASFRDCNDGNGAAGQD